MSALLESVLDEQRRAECALHDAELAAADLELAKNKATRWHARNDASAAAIQLQMADCERQGVAS